MALFFLHGLSSSISWPAATGGSSVTCNHRYFEAKDESLLSDLRLLMRKPEFRHPPFVTTVEQTSPPLKKDSHHLNYIKQVFLIYLVMFLAPLSSVALGMTMLVAGSRLKYSQQLTDCHSWSPEDDMSP